jgi:hypothetical protein
VLVAGATREQHSKPQQQQQQQQQPRDSAVACDREIVLEQRSRLTKRLGELRDEQEELLLLTEQQHEAVEQLLQLLHVSGDHPVSCRAAALEQHRQLYTETAKARALAVLACAATVHSGLAVSELEEKLQRWKRLHTEWCNTLLVLKHLVLKKQRDLLKDLHEMQQQQEEDEMQQQQQQQQQEEEDEQEQQRRERKRAKNQRQRARRRERLQQEQQQQQQQHQQKFKKQNKQNSKPQLKKKRWWPMKQQQ